MSCRRFMMKVACNIPKYVDGEPVLGDVVTISRKMKTKVPTFPTSPEDVEHAVEEFARELQFEASRDPDYWTRMARGLLTRVEEHDRVANV